MNTTAKYGMICGAAATLLSAVISVAPVQAQLAPTAPPVSPVHGYKHGEQRTDYLHKNTDIANEDASIRAKQHTETNAFHTQDAQLHAEDLAYRKAHNGQLGAGIAARLNRDRGLDKENELTAQHRATYKAQFNTLRADKQYSAKKERMQFKNVNK